MKFDLSIVVPAYKPGNKILSDIQTKKLVLDKIDVTYELIYVFDGFISSSQNKFFQEALEFAENESTDGKSVKILGYEKNRGKGRAVRLGFDNSNGKFIGFIDFLEEISSEYIIEFYKTISENGLDIVIANKFHNQSTANHSPKGSIDKILRSSLTSKLYLLYVRILTGLKLPDTQTGLKLFRGDAMRNLLSKLVIDRFAFDVEMISAMFRNGFDNIRALPINLSIGGESTGKSGGSTLNFWGGNGIVKTLFDVAKTGFNARILKKYNK